MLARVVVPIAILVAVLALRRPGGGIDSVEHNACHAVGISLLRGRRANVIPPPPTPSGSHRLADCLTGGKTARQAPELKHSACRRWKTARCACATSALGTVASSIRPSGALLAQLL